MEFTSPLNVMGGMFPSNQMLKTNLQKQIQFQPEPAEPSYIQTLLNKLHALGQFITSFSC